MIAVFEQLEPTEFEGGVLPTTILFNKAVDYMLTSVERQVCMWARFVSALLSV